MIRVATPADAETIARVHVATWRAAYAGLIPDEFLARLNVAANASRWESLLADPERRVWLSGETGFVAAGPVRDADLPPDTGEIYAAYVLPSAQRRGAGRALLDAALAWFGQAGRPGAALWVLRDNAHARAFYETCGWRADEAAREWDIGGVWVHEVRYQRQNGYEGAT